jgi:hypothetical protein
MITISSSIAQSELQIMSRKLSEVRCKKAQAPVKGLELSIGRTCASNIG